MDENFVIEERNEQVEIRLDCKDLSYCPYHMDLVICQSIILVWQRIKYCVTNIHPEKVAMVKGFMQNGRFLLKLH